MIESRSGFNWDDDLMMRADVVDDLHLMCRVIDSTVAKRHRTNNTRILNEF